MDVLTVYCSYRIQYFTLSLIKHFNAMIIFFLLQAFCCISTGIFYGEDHRTEYNCYIHFNGEDFKAYLYERR